MLSKLLILIKKKEVKIKMDKVQFPTWQELKDCYKERLKEIVYVEEAGIKIYNEDADVIIKISEYSIDNIKELARLDLEINLNFRPLWFHVEYKIDKDYIIPNDFEYFYRAIDTKTQGSY